ncbi:MAG: PA2778 family cysteine peptidase [Candidatus Thiodiazotropha sp.]
MKIIPGESNEASVACLAVVLLLLASGCTSHPPLLLPLLPSDSPYVTLELETTPFHSQKDYQCGPAALATLLEDSGIAVTAESLLPQVYLPKKRGSLQLEMVAASRRYNRIPYVIKPDLNSLLKELQAERPVVVLQNLGLSLVPVWHYAVVIGYSAQKDEIILRSGVTRRKLLSSHRFLDTWKAGSHWGMILLKPGELPAAPELLPYLKAVAAMERLAPADSLIAAYGAALRRWPDSSIAHFGLAAAHHAKGQLKAAEDGYRKVLANKPDDPATLNNLAEVLNDRGCREEALAMLNRALRNEPGVLRQHLLETAREIEDSEATAPNRPRHCQ